MNKAKFSRRALLAAVLLPAAAAFLPSTAQAASLYWDLNGTAAGSVNAPSTSPNSVWNGVVSTWNQSAAGTGAVSFVTTIGDDLRFAAGGNSAGAALTDFTVYLAGTGATSGIVGGQDAGNIFFDNGSAHLKYGLLNLATTSVITTNTATASISSAISQQTGPAAGTEAGSSLTFAGSGVLTLGGVNTYAGTTTISSGATVKLASNTALGAANNTTVQSGAALQLSDGLYIAGESLNLAGEGIGGTGALRVVSGSSNIWDGMITLTDDARINVDSGLGILMGGITGGGHDLTIGGVSDTNITTVAMTLGVGALIKDGAGTLSLTTANTYTGGTTISSGLIAAKASGALGSGLISVAGTGAALQLQGDVTLGNSLTLSGSGIDGNGALRNLSGNNSVTGAVTLAGATTIRSDDGVLTLGNISGTGQALTIAGAGNTVINAINTGTGGTLYKTGLGVLELVHAGDFSGGTVISQGTLYKTTVNDFKLGGGGVVLGDADTGNANVAFVFDSYMGFGNIPTQGVDVITVDARGGGTVLIGAISSSPALNSFALILGTNFNLNRPTTLVGGNAGTASGVGGISIEGKVSGNVGALTVTGSRIIFANSSNDFVGSVIIKDTGLLQTGHYESGTHIGYGNPLSVEVGGVFQLAGRASNIDGLSGGGHVSTVPTLINATSNLIIGSINGSGVFSGDVSNGYGLLYMEKVGSGVQVFSNQGSTVKGVLTLTGGVLSVTRLSDGGVVSSIGASTGVASNLVFNGGSLRYENYLGVGATGDSTNRLITVTNNGGIIEANGSGALVLSNTGAIAMSGSGARTLRLTGTNTDENRFNLAIGNGTGGDVSFVKNGAGTWVLGGTNTFLGGTTLNAGTLILDRTTSDTAKLGGGALALAGGTLTLRTNSANNETVSGTTLRKGTASTVTRAGTGSGVLVLGGVTVESGASLDIAAENIGATSSANVNGMLDGWITIAGESFAAAGTTSVAGQSLIVRAMGLETVADGGVIGDDATKSWVINDTSANNGGNPTGGAAITLASATTSVHRLLQEQSIGGTTVNFAGRTLVFGQNGGVLMGDDDVALTLGSTLNDGVITGGTGSATALYLDNSSVNTLTVNASIRDNGAGVLSLIKAGSGVVRLTGTNTFTGAIEITGGVLEFTHHDNLGTGPDGAEYHILNGGSLRYVGTTDRVTTSVFSVGSAGGTVDSSGTGTVTYAPDGSVGRTIGFNNQVGVRTLTLTGTNTGGNDLGLIIADNAGATSLVKSDVGTWTLSAANTYTGTTTVSGGTLVVGIDSVNTNLVLTSGALGRSALVMTGSGLVDLNGFDLAIASLEGQAGNLVSMGAQTLTVGFDGTDTTFTGSITGTDGALTKVGTGSLTLAGQNSHTGPTSVQGGTLRAGVAGQAFGLNSAVIVGAAGNLDLNGFSQTIGSLASLGGVKLGTGTLTLGTDNTNTTYNGVMSGSGAAALVKVGTGTQTMNGEHTFTGSVSINAGALRIQNGQSLGTGTTGKLTVASGAALELEGGFTTAYAYGASLAGAGVSEGGAIRHVSGANNYTGIITLADDARINSDSGTLTLSGDVDVGANTLTLGGAGAMTVSGNLGAGAGALVKDGAGVTTFTGEMLSTGGLTVSQGTLAVDYTAGSNRVATANTLTLHDGATLRFDNLQANNQTFAGVSLTGSGTSRLVLGMNRTTGVVNLTSVTNTGGVGVSAMDVSNMLSDPATSWLRISGLPSVLNLTASHGITGNGGVDVLETDNTGRVYIAQTMDYSRGGAIEDTASAVRLIESGVGTNIPGEAITLANALVSVPTILNAYTATTAAPDTTITLAIGNGNTLLLANEGSVTSTAGTNLAITGGTLSAGATGTAANIAFNSGSDTNGNGGIITVSSEIKNNGAGNIVSISKIGEGTLVLTGTNYYTGTATIHQGTLQVGDGGNEGYLGSGGVINHGTLVFNRSGSYYYAYGIEGTGDLVQAGPGAVYFTGVNTYTGTTFVNAGVLDLVTVGSIVDSGAVSVGAAGTLRLSVSKTLGSLTGVSGGTVSLQANNLTIGDATSTTYAGSITGTGGVTKVGTGTLTLSGTNTYTGVTALNAGVLVLSGGTAIVDTGAVAISGTAVLRLASSETIGALTGVSSVDLQANTLTVGAGTNYAGVISGTGGFAKVGAGTATLSGSNTYTGVTTASGGTLTISGSVASSAVSIENAGSLVVQNGNALLDTVAVTSAGNGNFTLQASETIGSLAGTGTVTLGANTLTTGGATDTTYNGVISGTGALVKQGAGVFTLGGASTYTGATQVNAGKLNLAGSLTSAITVASGATLMGAGSTTGTATILDGGILSNSQGVSLTTGTMTLANTSIIELGLASPDGHAVFNVNGDLTLDGVINITNLGGPDFAPGVYRVFNYTGNLTNNTADFGTLPAGISASDLAVQTSLANQVNIVNLSGADLNFWDGANMVQDGVVDGGTGVWNSTDSNWTTVHGSVNGPQTKGFLIFQGTAGTVTVDNTGVAIGGTGREITGMQFFTTGYTVTGGEIALTNASVLDSSDPATVMLSVGDGSASGSSITATIGSVLADGVSGPVNLEKTGLGTLILSGNNTYTGSTTVSGGTLVLSGQNAYTGATIINAGTLRVGAGGTTGEMGAANVTNNGTLVFDRSDAISVAQVIFGTGDFVQAGTGTTTLTAANTYSGTTTVSAGKLVLGATGAIGAGNIITNGIFEVEGTADRTLANVISGTGSLTMDSTAMLTLTGTNTFSGGVLLENGTLDLGSAGALGTAGTISFTAGTLRYSTVNANDYSSRFSTAANQAVSIDTNDRDVAFVTGLTSTGGTLTKSGAGILTLSGASTYTGATQVNAGNLNLAGSLTSAITVASGATLIGAGSTTGTATILAGGILSNSQGVSLTTGTMTLANTSIIELGLASPDGNAVFNVNGDLTLDGVINITNLGGPDFAPGVYRVFNYTGALTNNTADFGTIPTGVLLGDLSIQTSVANQVNIVNLTGASLHFWDGSNTVQNGGVNGGAGTWSSAGTNWTTANGDVNGPQSAGYLIFQGIAGTVTVDNNATAPIGGAGHEITGMQFMTTGYELTGSVIALTNASVLDPLDDASVILRVGDNTAQSINITTTISSVLADGASGAANIDKTDLGTLILSGNNTYSGTTKISAGTLRIGAGGTTGALGTGNVTNNGKLEFNRSDSIFVNQVISGTGSLVQMGSGKTTLTAANSYMGTTTISSGTLEIQGVGTLGTGSVTNNGTFAVSNSGAMTLVNVISGTGKLVHSGLNTLTVTGTNTFTGGVDLSSGVLNLGSVGAIGTTGSLSFVNGTLQYSANNNTDYSSRFSTAVGQTVSLDTNGRDVTFATGLTSTGGTLNKSGAGTLTLTGASTYSGATTITAGTLSVGDGGTTGSLASGAINNAGALVFNRSNDLTAAHAINGTGTVTKLGAGTLTLSGASTYTGATTITAGTVDLTGTLGDTATTVASGATLTGTGTTTGSVTIAAGSILKNEAGRVLTTGDLALSSTSQIHVSLGAASSAALFNVEGNLTLDGVMNVANIGGFGMGVYRIFDYSGSLVNNGVTFGTLPTGVLAANLSLQTSVANQVNLVSSVGGQFVFWDGAGSMPNGLVNGGSGTWSSVGTNWTLSTGEANGTFVTTPQPGFAVFQTVGGTVTINNGAGSVKASGMQFNVDGYTVTGDMLTLANDSSSGVATIRVGDGTQASSAMTATIAAVLQDDGAVATNLVKTDYGTLALSGNNTYTGTTTVSVGTLQIGAGGTTGTLGAGATSVASGATLAYNRIDAVLFDRVITGDGAFSQIGAGVLTVTGANTYTGGTTIGTNSEISLNATGALGTGAVANSGTLSFASSTAKTFANTVTGTGSLVVGDTGAVTLSGTSTYTGATQVNNGASLIVTGVLGNTATNVDGTLSGTGSIAGAVTVSSTGTLLGTSGATLTTGDLVFGANSSVLDVSLPTTGTAPLFVANGDVTVDGVVSLTTAADLDYGVYRVINYTGALTDNTAVIGTVTGGLTVADFAVQTSESGWVNIVRGDSSTGGGVGTGHTFWNGAGVANSGVIAGGTGTWSSTGTNWTTIAGLDDDVQSSGFLIFQGTGGDVTLAGEVGGAGQEVNGMQFASNGYHLSGGSIRLTNDTGSGDVVMRVGAGAGASTTATLDTVLTGSANLRKTDGGTLVLTQSNTYTGSTSVQAGVLQLGDAGVTGSLFAGSRVILGQDGTLAFNRFDRVSFGNAIEGAGTLVQKGAGTLVIVADSTRSGVTRVESGTLQVGDSSTGGRAGTLGSGEVDLLGGASLTFDRVDTYAAGNRIVGAGTVVVRNGSLTFAGDNTYTGRTTVRSGAELRLTTNSSTGDLVVDAGGLFGGTGTVRGNLINNGVVAPGFSPGTLNVSGNFTQSSGGVLQIELESATLFDRVVVTGTATLNGKIQIVNAGYVVNRTDTFQVLTAAGGISGSLTLDAPLYAAAGMQLSVNANDVVLSFTPSVPNPNPVVFPNLTPNQNNIANAVVDLLGNGGAPTLTGIVAGTPSSQLPAVLNALSPQGIDRWWENLRHNTVAMVRSTETRMDRLADNAKHDFEIWAQMNQRESYFKKNLDEQHARGSASGVTVGADVKPSEEVVVGALFQYGNERIFSSMRTEISHYTLAAYGRYDLPLSIRNTRVFIDGMFGFGYGDYDAKRQVSVPGYYRTAVSDTHATDVFSSLRLGLETKYKGFGITPYIAAAHTRYRVSGYGERDAGEANLTVNDVRAESLAMRLGLAIDAPFMLSGVRITPKLNVAWRHEFRDDGMTIGANMAGTDFTVRGIGAKRDGLEAAFSLNLGLNDHWDVYGSVGAYVDGNEGSSQNYQVGVSYKF